VPFNGGFGGAQRAWLRGALAAARAARERVVVLSHVALHPAACDGTTMAWDYDAVLGLLAEVSVMCVTSCVSRTSCSVLPCNERQGGCSSPR
jgi:manganese-dependent ADP-ribose/CDP-alcohol diphosphatase